MPFIEYLEPAASVDPSQINVDQPPNAWFQLSIAVSLKRIADLLEASEQGRAGGASVALARRLSGVVNYSHEHADAEPEPVLPPPAPPGD